MRQFLQVLRDLALLIARVGLGGILIAHGWRRWKDQGIQQQIDYVAQFGTPFPEVVGWGATILELVGGVFLVVGALTPLVAAAVLAEQVLIIAYTSWNKGLFLLDTEGGYAGGFEFTVALGLLALLLVVFGAGRAAIDQLFRRTPGDRDNDVDDNSYA